jgi:hypothetical protein
MHGTKIKIMFAPFSGFQIMCILRICVYCQMVRHERLYQSYRWMKSTNVNVLKGGLLQPCYIRHIFMKREIIVPHCK